MTETQTARPGARRRGDMIPALRRFFSACVASEQPDLTQRQLAVLLAVYVDDQPWTVRGLAAALNVSRPAITRAMDRLGELDLAHRQIDPMDRRSVLLCRTLAGALFVRSLRAKMQEALAS